MSFPDWGHSYNALYVPLRRWGWQCALMPAGEVKADRSFEWPSSYEEREKKRKEWKKQIEQDKEDFQRFFRVDIDKRRAAISFEFRQYADFLRETLQTSSCNMPISGDDITRVLHNAVRDGRIIPVIDRAWYGGRRVFKRYAPQHSSHRSGGSAVISNEVPNAPTGRFTGPFAAAMHAADTVMRSWAVKSNRATISAASGGGSDFDWLGAAESFGEATLDDKRLGDSSNDRSLLGDARSFDYLPDIPEGDAFEIAKTPNLGEPGTWYTNPGSGQMRLYGANGKPVVDLDFDHTHNGLRPHAHNWGPNGRDSGFDVVPFSPWSF
ncbi:hypothetical protein [Paraburkholderia bannensis]|uniref:hypothetical protein n=1 Tax=Paraburkholderia bannensis TaxID=765414 RepID=UPI002AB723AD|nr:hypothetical protein [Paraburkholderia bannensis]